MLEAEEGYSHAEVEKVLVKEREMAEATQELKYRIECLEGDLQEANHIIEEQKSQVIVRRYFIHTRKISPVVNLGIFWVLKWVYPLFLCSSETSIMGF